MKLSGLEHVRQSADPMDLGAARRDLWPRDTLAMREGAWPPTPARVFWPADEAEAAAVLERAVGEGLAVVPYGAGSGVCGGAAGRAGSVVIDTKRLMRVGPVDLERRCVQVQAGVLGQHLENTLGRQGWMVGHSPSSIACSTVGGYVAARSAGQFSSRYGVFDDMLLGARALTPTGRIDTGIWTPDGEEDLLPILAGSEGCLGLITDALVRVVPLPERRWLRAYAFPHIEAAWAAMRDVLQAELWPSVMRLYDPVDTRIGGPARGARKARRTAPPSEGARFFEAIKDAATKIPGLRHHLLDLPLALPGLVNRIADGLGEEVLLVLGFEGSAIQVDASMAAAASLMGPGRDLGADPGEYWFAHRHEVSYKLAPIFIGGGFADTMEVAAPWSKLPELHRRVRQALSPHAVVMAHFSHAYPEGCSIYFSFAGAGREEVYDAAWSGALAAASEAGGTVTHHHGVGLLKAGAAAREAGASVRVWREIKGRLDPEDRMNPGRLFPDPDPEPAEGPPAPTGGPIHAIDPESLLADVDPEADPATLAAALAARGFELRFKPDRPVGDWLRALRRGAMEAWEAPLFAIQARFEDGRSVRIGGWPRSAAGPDLRWGLLRRAKAELVQLPIRLLDPRTRLAVTLSRPADPWDLRPAGAKGNEWLLSGAAAANLLAALGTPSPGPVDPTRDPTKANFEAATAPGTP